MVWKKKKKSLVIYSVRASVLIRNAVLWRHEPFFNYSVIYSWLSTNLSKNVINCELGVYGSFIYICSLLLFRIDRSEMVLDHTRRTFQEIFRSWKTTLTSVKNLWSILGRVRLGYSGIKIYSGIYSGYSVPGSRIAGMEIEVFRNENSSQTNAFSH